MSTATLTVPFTDYDSLAQLRDDLKVRIHLGEMDARDQWQKHRGALQGLRADPQGPLSLGRSVSSCRRPGDPRGAILSSAPPR
jgi:hypothetical protein